jgi:AcrR family transcriptional regulator
LRDLAAQVGASAPALYHHFANKEILLATVAQDVLRRMDYQSWALLRVARIASMHLESLGMQYLTTAYDDPALFSLVFVHSRPKLLAVGADPTATDAPVFRTLVSFMTHALPKANAVTHIQRAIAAWSVVHGYAMLAIQGPLTLSIPNRSDFLTFARSSIDSTQDSILRGCTKRLFTVPAPAGIEVLPTQMLSTHTHER